MGDARNVTHAPHATRSPTAHAHTSRRSGGHTRPHTHTSAPFAHRAHEPQDHARATIMGTIPTKGAANGPSSRNAPPKKSEQVFG